MCGGIVVSSFAVVVLLLLLVVMLCLLCLLMFVSFSLLLPLSVPAVIIGFWGIPCYIVEFPCRVHAVCGVYLWYKRSPLMCVVI